MVIDFSEVLWRGQINCKIVLDILQKPPGFHTTAREPKRTFGTDASNTTKIPREDPPEREKERTWGRERGKKGEILGCPAEGVPRRVPECPEGWEAHNFAFFFSLAPQFSFFLPLLEVVSWNFGGCWTCAVAVLGLF